MNRCLALLVSLLAVGTACHTPPERACERVRFGWPFFQLDPSSDSSEAEGLQVSFDVRSDLQGGVNANLFLRTGDDETQAFVGEAVSDSDGLLSFADVTIPEGDIVFIVEARDECGTQRSGRSTFVWDGLGLPTCEMQLALEPEMPADGSIPVLGPEHDEDASEAGMQVRVQVESGRPDMEVTLFTRDRELDESREFTAPSDSTGRAEFEVTLPAGEQAIRAVCYWEPQELRPSTATHLYIVDAP